VNDKKYIFSIVNSGDPLFYQGKNKLLKTPKCKMYIQYSEKFLDNSVFQGKRSCSKILNSKKYIRYSEKFQGKLFSGQAQIVKNPEYKKYIHYSENFLGNFVFSGQAPCSLGV